MIKNVNRLQSHFANTVWKDTLYIFHSYLSLLSYIFYPLYFFSWLCVLNHEKFILLQVEIKPLQKGGNRRKEFTLIQYVFIWHNKAFLLILGGLKSAKFQTSNRSKVTNAHDVFRGLYLFGYLGNCGTSDFSKKKVPRFFYVRTQREETIQIALGRATIIKHYT